MHAIYRDDEHDELTHTNDYHDLDDSSGVSNDKLYSVGRRGRRGGSMGFSRARHVVSFSLAICWVLLGAWQYGFGISQLNAAQAQLTCIERPSYASFGLPECVAMSDFDFGALTSAYTLGGFVSSFTAGSLADKHGRRNAAVCSAALVMLGSCIMAFSSSLALLILGRLLIGVACGVNTVLVPLYLSELAQAHVRGATGVGNQVAICLGIFSAQAVSIPLTSEHVEANWRWIPLVSACVAGLQLVSAPCMLESPKWLAEYGKATKQALMLPETPNEANTPDPFDRTPHDDNDDDEASSDAGAVEAGEADLDDAEDSRALLSSISTWSQIKYERQLTMSQVLRSADSEVRHGLHVVLLAMTFQQVSGINAVMYYSTSILSEVMPVGAKVIALAITSINLVMTFPPIVLIDRVGARPLLLVSLASMGALALVLAFAINHAIASLATFAIIGFVAAFSIGLGPVPFTLLGEVPPHHATSATASIGLGLNWAANFLVGLLFLPMRNALSRGPGTAGNVFFLFASLSALGALSCARVLRS